MSLREFVKITGDGRFGLVKFSPDELLTHSLLNLCRLIVILKLVVLVAGSLVGVLCLLFDQ